MAHAYKVYIAIHGEFDLVLGNLTRLTSLRSVVIAPDQPHKLIGRTADVALLFVLPETPEGQAIARRYGRQKVFGIPPEGVRALTPMVRRFWQRGGTRQEAVELSDLICRYLVWDQNAPVRLDRRIERALIYLDAQGHYHPTIPEVASVAVLSPSRFRHLFNEQVGIPMSRYLLWVRLRKALELMSLSGSLTEVAHEVGFADQAHLCRTFRRMLGITPSLVYKKINLHSSSPAGVAGFEPPV